MAIERFINDFQTTLNGSILSGTNPITVTAGTSIAAQFRCRIDDEILIVTAGGDGTSWTVTRGAESTTAAAHSNGATVTVVQTAGSFEQAIADRVRTGTYANLPSTSDALEGHEYITTDSFYRFRFNGTNWLAYYHDELVTLPPTSGWTWDNQESGDDVDFDLGSMNFKAIRTAVGEHTIQYRTAPSAPYSVEFLIEHDYSGLNAGSGGGRDANIGLYFRDSTGKFVYFGVGSFNNSLGFNVDYWTDNNNVATANVISDFDNTGGAMGDAAYRSPIRLKIIDDNTNIEFYWAAIKNNWIQFGSSLSRTAHLASGPTQYGIGGYKGDGTIRMNVISIIEG